MRRNLIASVLLLSSATLALAEEAAKPATAKAAPAKTGSAKAAGTAPATESAKTLYAIGLVMSQNLGPLKLSPAEFASVQDGIADGVLGRPPKVELQTYGPKI